MENSSTGKSLTARVPEHWNEAQRHVWKNVDQHWRYLVDKNIEEFIKFIHPDFTGYGHESPVPVDRPWLEKWVGFWTKNTQIPICDLRPIEVVLHGDIAIVQYFLFTVELNAEGGKRVVRRYTMTWKNAPDRWVVIGSHNNLVSDTHKG